VLVIPALRKLQEEDHEFKASLGYKVRLYFKQTKEKHKQKDTYAMQGTTFPNLIWKEQIFL
jgi:hypothetical protein